MKSKHVPENCILQSTADLSYGCVFLYYHSPYTTKPSTFWFYNMQKSLQRTNRERKTAAGYDEYRSVDDYRETNHLPMCAAVLFCSFSFLFVC